MDYEETPLGREYRRKQEQKESIVDFIEVRENQRLMNMYRYGLCNINSSDPNVRHIGLGQINAFGNELRKRGIDPDYR